MRIIAVLIALLVAIPVAAQQAPSAATPPAPSTAAPQQGAGLPSMIRDGYYVLQVGDELAIRVFEQSQLDETIKIRPDGRISAMLLEDIPAAGQTTRELNAQLTAQYARFYREPKVSVIVRQFSNLKIYVGGEVGQPGTIPLSGDITALSAIFQAGGLKTTARTDSVVLLRNVDGRATAYGVNVKEILSSGSGDVKLQPFDVVYVPASKIAKVDRFVDQYIRQLIPLTLTGGFSYIFGNSVLIR